MQACLSTTIFERGLFMLNHDVRQAAKDAGVPHWKIAEALGINEFSFSRKLRHELPAKEREEILRVIGELAHKGSDGGR